MPQPVYEKEHEWSGYSIYASPKGWHYRGWSRYSGSRTDVRMYLPYDGEFPKGTNLNRRWNDNMTYGDALHHTIKMYGVFLDRGRLVQ
jgi:hypothetical protein